MSLANPFNGLAMEPLFGSFLPDFVLASAFFIALIYAVLGKRFSHQRSAVTASAALGLALAIGFVWWEQRVGLSIRDLGAWAVGFAVIILAGVMYQAIRQTGGTWAGAGIALGASLLVGWIMGMRWPVAEAIVQTVIVVAIIVGMVAFMDRRGTSWATAVGKGHRDDVYMEGADAPSFKRDVKAVEEGEILSDLLTQRFKKLAKQSKQLHEHPRDAEDILLQLRRMLPAEGWLTERLTRLREKLQYVQRGEADRVGEIRSVFSKMPQAAQASLAKEMSEHLKQIKLDTRLDRLDKAVASNERQIIELTRQAEVSVTAHDFPKLHELLKTAQKLQKHNSRLFAAIDRSEKKLLHLAEQLARQQEPVKKD